MYFGYNLVKPYFCKNPEAPTLTEKLVAGGVAGTLAMTAVYPLYLAQVRRERGGKVQDAVMGFRMCRECRVCFVMCLSYCFHVNSFPLPLLSSPNRSRGLLLPAQGISRAWVTSLSRPTRWEQRRRDQRTCIHHGWGG